MAELVWTTEPPAVPGWYWALEQGMSRHVVVEVIESLTPTDLAIWDDYNECCVTMDCMVKWAGPIPEPVEGMSFRQMAERAVKWARERDERLAHISRLQNEYKQFEETCEHWSSREIKTLDGTRLCYVKCEWCGKEWEPVEAEP